MDISNRYSTLKEKLYPLGFRQDALELANNTFALLISYVLSYWMITTVSLAFVGHLGQNELNGCALATTTYYLIADPILFGLNYGCETLLPQCYGGNKRKMGVVLQRGMIIATYACFIIWAIMLNAVG